MILANGKLFIRNIRGDVFLVRTLEETFLSYYLCWIIMHGGIPVYHVRILNNNTSKSRPFSCWTKNVQNVWWPHVCWDFNGTKPSVLTMVDHDFLILQNTLTYFFLIITYLLITCRQTNFDLCLIGNIRTDLKFTPCFFT